MVRTGAETWCERELKHGARRQVAEAWCRDERLARAPRTARRGAQHARARRAAPRRAAPRCDGLPPGAVRSAAAALAVGGGNDLALVAGLCVPHSHQSQRVLRARGGARGHAGWADGQQRRRRGYRRRQLQRRAGWRPGAPPHMAHRWAWVARPQEAPSPGRKPQRSCFAAHTPHASAAGTPSAPCPSSASSVVWHSTAARPRPPRPSAPPHPRGTAPSPPRRAAWP